MEDDTVLLIAAPTGSGSAPWASKSSVTATKNGRDWESSVANATNTFTCISNPHVVMAEFTFQGKEAITKEVTKTGTGAHVFVPKDWMGEEVAIIRLDQD